ncbi:MAG: class B sortase [Mollicutes bacterium]|nr:class B sortase [Mollicutes bacterium]MDY5875125.1 class B sortase [Bacilli bacterium]
MKRERNIKVHRKRFGYKYLLFTFLFILILFLIFLLIKNIFMPEKVIFESVSHDSEISKMEKKYNNSDYDVIGWIDVAGTNLNMPILRAIHESGDYPVTMEKYAWSLSDKKKYYNFMAIFGHNLMNLGVPKKSDSSFKRFEELMSFIYEDFAKEHKYFQYTINGKTYVYKIFSVDIDYASTIYEFPKHGASKNEMKSLIKEFKDNSIYKYNVDVNEDDDILVLTTCTRLFAEEGYYDMLVAGKRIESNEKATDYSFTKTEKYKKIEKILKGDDIYEK